MNLKIGRKIITYVIISLVNILALLLSLALASRMTFDPFFLFVPTVALTAWYGGAIAGSLSILFVILATDFFLLPPLYSIDFLATDTPRFAIFIIVAVIVYLLSGNRKRSVEARQRLEAIVDASEDAIVGITLDGRISSWNKGAETIYGYSAQEVLGNSISKILLPERNAQAAAALEQIKRGEPVSPFEMVHTTRNDRLIDLSINIVPIKNGIGEVVGATIRVSDITERKRTQELLNNRYIAIENIADVVFITDGQGIIEYVNPAFETITGYSKKEVLGKTPRLLKSNQHDPEFYKTLWHTILSGQVFRSELINRKKNGNLYYELKTITPIKDHEGNVTGFVSTGKDVTERVQARKILKRQAEDRSRELATLYDITAIGSTTFDLPMVLDRSLERIVSAMGAICGEIYLLDEDSGGMKLSASCGEPSSQAVATPNTNAQTDSINWVATHGKPLALTEIAIESADTLAAPVDLKINHRAFVGVPIGIENRVIGVLSATRETTRPFRAEEITLLVSIGAHLGITIERIRLFEEAQGNAALEERARLARELHDSVTQNVYGVGLLAETAKRFITTGDVESASRYLGRLGELSQQSLKEMRLLVYELRPLALTKDNLIEALRHRLNAVEQRAGVEVCFESDDSVHLPASVEEALYRVAQEALNNSLTHSEASSVTVSLHAEAKHVELKVEDNGKGFNPQPAGESAGLGLHSMKQRIERVGGTLDIISNPGEGTRVVADVPLQ